MSMVEKQLIWNVKIDMAEQGVLSNEYTIVILNEEGNIRIIRQSFLEQMFPSSSPSGICNFPLPRDSGSHI